MFKKLITIGGVLVLSILLTGALPARSLVSPAQAGFQPGLSRLAPDVRAALSWMEPTDKLAVIVVFEDQSALDKAPSGRVSSLTESRHNTIQALQDQSKNSHQKVESLLQNYAAQGKASEFTSFWIFNGFSIKATPEVIEVLAQLPGVAQILPDRVFTAPQSIQDLGQVEGNINVTNATSLWDLGFRGQGIVVANMDTGVSLNHPDLRQQWRGGTNSWFDPHGQHPDLPTDKNGHGTWTMGIMVGRDNSGSFIGVAPEAQWIAVKIFNDSGQSTSSRIHAGFQWLLDPDGDPSTDDAPHVVNNSWSFLSTGCYLDFRSSLRALRTAGILPIFAAGNAGPSISSSVSPSNYPEAFSVGAIDNWGSINIGSSRGPSSCGGRDTVFPDLVAPGVGIFSSSLNNGYTQATGTSMAAPHAAGGLALLLNAFPGLSIEKQEAALKKSARDLGVPGPDDIYGYGSLDIFAAYRWLDPNATNNPGIPDTGEVTLTLFLPTLLSGR